MVARVGRPERAAARRVVNDRALQALAGVEFEPLEDPVGALLRLASETEALRGLLRQEVARIQSIATTDRTGAEQVRAVLAAYQTAISQSSRLLTDIAKIGLEASYAASMGQHARALGTSLSAWMRWLVDSLLATVGVDVRSLTLDEDRAIKALVVTLLQSVIRNESVAPPPVVPVRPPRRVPIAMIEAPKPASPDLRYETPSGSGAL
jgi:hypothetical protein